MKPQSTRDIAFEHLSGGKTKAQIADSVLVHRSTIHRFMKEGKVKKRNRRLGRRKLAAEQEAALLAKVSNTPAVTMSQLATYAKDRFGVAITERTAAGIMRRNKITYKKGTKINIRYKRELGLKLLEDIRQLYSPLVASVDEASFMLNMAPTCGWAPKGQRLSLAEGQ